MSAAGRPPAGALILFVQTIEDAHLPESEFSRKLYVDMYVQTED